MKPTPISELPLVTLAEVAEICGWTQDYAKTYMKRKKVPAYKVSPSLYLYSVQTVREILWKKEKRLMNRQKAPFMIPELIDFLKRYHAAQNKGLPSDEDYLKDDLLGARLQRLVETGNPRQLKDFAGKAELARRVLQILEK